MTKRLTVAVLLYGDYPWLAQRVLDPLLALCSGPYVDLRVGCNAVGPGTDDYLCSRGLPVVPGVTASGGVTVVRSAENLHKYPMMRRLMRTDPLAEHFMWFDDDSFIDTDGDPMDVIKGAVARCAPDTMVGQVYSIRLGGNQHLWVRAQPWYTGKPVDAGQVVSFCTGGWWTVRSDFLEKHDWPCVELSRKGGDVMLGELCRQQGVRLVNVGPTFGVRVNADAEGKNSKSQTRGPMPLPKPIGWYHGREY